MVRKLIIMFILVLSVAKPSYGYKFFIVNKLSKPVWVKLNVTGITESTGPIYPGLQKGHLLKFPGSACLTTVHIKFNKEDEYKQLEGFPGVVFYLCMDRSVIITRGRMKLGDLKTKYKPKFDLRAFPKIKYKKIHQRSAKIVDLSAEQNYQEDVNKIVKSDLFDKNKNALFDIKRPQSMHVGSIVLPKGSTYNLGQITLNGTGEEISIKEKYGKTPVLSAFMKNKKIVFKPNDMNQYPILTIQVDEKNHQLFFTSILHNKVIKRLTIHGDALIKYFNKILPKVPKDEKKHQTTTFVSNDKLFYSGFPLYITLNFTIDNDKGVQIDSLDVRVLYNEFWNVVRGDYKKPPRKQNFETLKAQELKKNKIVTEQ